MIEKKQYDMLLEEYRTIWNNRQLHVNELESETVLRDAIRRDLLDENTHPRVRKNRYQKYYTAIKRVVMSSVANDNKIRLIEIHNQIMEELSGGGD